MADRHGTTLTSWSLQWEITLCGLILFVNKVNWNKHSLDPSIAGTKCHRDEPIVSADRGGQLNHAGIK